MPPPPPPPPVDLTEVSSLLLPVFLPRNAVLIRGMSYGPVYGRRLHAIVASKRFSPPTRLIPHCSEKSLKIG